MDKDISLTFCGNPHDAAKLKALAATGPKIEVLVSDLNSFDTTVFPEGGVEWKGNPIGVAEHDTNVIFFKQHGKYTLLTGRTLLRERSDLTKITGHLISGPSLKKARTGVELYDAAPPLRPPRSDFGYPNNEQRGNRFQGDRRRPGESSGSSLPARPNRFTQRTD